MRPFLSAIPTGTKEQKAPHRKWGRAIDVALNKARPVVAAPAQTLEGMLMKIHVAGFIAHRNDEV